MCIKHTFLDSEKGEIKIKFYLEKTKKFIKRIKENYGSTQNPTRKSN